MVCAAGTGCRDTPLAFGPTPAVARARGGELFEGLEQRFTNVQRSPEFALARAKLGRAALIPSRVYDDSAVWTSIDPDGARTLLAAGRYAGDHYIFAATRAAPRPERLAESRHEVRLVGEGHGAFQWTTSVDQAIGSITAEDVDRVLGSMLRAAATTPESNLRAGAYAAFPHATTALGRLLSLDTVHTTPMGDGTASVSLIIGMHPDQLRPIYPAYAAYLRKYVSPSRVRLTLIDTSGAQWFGMQLADGRITMQLRATSDGHFAPTTGAVRPMPDSLVLRSEFHDKVWVFSVGFSDLVADFAVEHAPHERAWSMRFHREPHWHFPLLADHLVKSSLRRPFAGDGASYRIGVRDTTAGITLLTRAARVDVQESTVMRWLGGLGANAMGDFSGRSEAEESAFFADALAALRADLREVPELSATPPPSDNRSAHP